MGFQFNVPVSRMERFALRLGMRALERKAEQIAALARVYAAPHGSISDTIDVARFGPKSYKITSYNPHTILVHNGSRPHWIRPIGGRSSRRSSRRPGYLRFEVGGRVVFAREVFHPGYEGDPFMRDALRNVPRGLV
jgi:hypothetical protein